MGIKCVDLVGLIGLIGLMVAIIKNFTPIDIYTYIRCDDPSIWKPFFKETITVPQLLMVLVFAPFILMTLIEWINYKPRGSGFWHGITTSTCHTFRLCIGAVLAFYLIELLKLSVSEARPHFMQLCDPVLPENCSSTTWVKIEPSDCQNPTHVSIYVLKKAMKSFPSGHAALSSFASVFMIMYLQARLVISWSQMFVPLLQFLSLSWAIVCSASRLWDNKHHCSDILTGALIGVTFSYATVVYLCNRFRPTENTTKSNFNQLDEQSQ